MVNHFPIYLKIYIYIPQQKTLTLKTDIYMQSGNSAILYVTAMLNDALFLFLLPLSLFICIPFSFFFCVLSFPVCVKVTFLPIKC